MFSISCSFLQVGHLRISSSQMVSTQNLHRVWPQGITTGCFSSLSNNDMQTGHSRSYSDEFSILLKFIDFIFIEFLAKNKLTLN